MNHQVGLTVLIVLATVLSACGEDHIGECQFHGAETVIKLSEELQRRDLSVLRKDSEPQNLHIDDIGIREGKGKLPFIKIELPSGRKSEVWVAHVPESPWPPTGYTAFPSGFGDLDPLIARGVVRFEHLGRTTPLPYLKFGEKKTTVRQENIFSGTRRIMYGTWPLVEQDFRNMRDLGDRVQYFVAVEPDGDRVVCLCQDMQGEWIGIFSKKKLEAEQKAVAR